jgi:hypothetical protein
LGCVWLVKSENQLHLGCQHSGFLHRYFVWTIGRMNIGTVFFLIDALVRLFFDHFFWKNCLTKMLLTPIFHFFRLISLRGVHWEGAFIRKNTVFFFVFLLIKSLKKGGGVGSILIRR